MSKKPPLSAEHKHDMRARIMEKYLSPYDPDHDSRVNGFLAHSSAQDERNDDDQEPTIPIFLSDRAKNRIMFYGRQDIGHALLNTISILRRLRTIKILLSVLIVLVVFLMWEIFAINGKS